MEQHEAVQKWDKQMSGMDWPITKPNTTSRGHVTFRLNKGLTIPILSLFQFQCILEVCKTVSLLSILKLLVYIIIWSLFYFSILVIRCWLKKERLLIFSSFNYLFITESVLNFKYLLKKKSMLNEKKEIKKTMISSFYFPF